MHVPTWKQTVSDSKMEVAADFDFNNVRLAEGYRAVPIDILSCFGQNNKSSRDNLCVAYTRTLKLRVSFPISSDFMIECFTIHSLICASIQIVQLHYMQLVQLYQFERNNRLFEL